MKILLVSSESYSSSLSPLARSIGYIAAAYRKLGACVVGFSPFFSKFEPESNYKEEGKFREKLRDFEYSVLKRTDQCPTNTAGKDLFIKFEDYFGRDGIYGDNREKSYSDNHFRFSFFASAAMNYCIETGFKPDAVHVHEWSGIAGALAKTVYKDYFQNVPVTLTIHNIRYDFHCSSRYITKMGLPAEGFNIDGYEFWDKISMLKAAILYSDKVAFTSASYLNHILATDSPGGIRGFLESQSRKLLGVQNGVDYSVWGIENDVEAFKQQKKDALRRELGLAIDSSMLVYSHLESNFDTSAQIISTILANLLNMNLQLVIGLSEEDPNYQFFTTIQEKNSSKIALLPLTENEEVLHHRLAAADIFFSINAEDPSLSLLLQASAAGSLPLSSRSANKSFEFLKPFERQKEEDNANAFVAADVSPDFILGQFRIAESVFCENKSLWSKLVNNASSLRVPWELTAEKYFSTFTPKS